MQLVKRQRTSSGLSRTVRRYGPPVARAAWNMYKAYSSGGTKRRSAAGSSQIVTTQHDVTRSYRRRRMPKRKRKRWVSALRRFRALSLKHMASRTRILTYDGTFTCAAGAQVMQDFALYGYFGAAYNWGFNDLERIADHEKVAQDASGPENTTPFLGNPKLIFRSAVLDMTITNTADTTVEIDIFYWYLTRKPPGEVLMSLLDNAATEAGTIDLGQTAVARALLGVTPFDLPASLRYYKISQVRKLIISAGQASSLMIRSPGNKVFNSSMLETELTTNDVFGLPGFTRGLLMVCKGVPSAADTDSTDVSITYSFQNKYHYSIWKSENPMDQYN